MTLPPLGPPSPRAPINRGTDPLSQRLYAHIFNGVSAANGRGGPFMSLSYREQVADAVYAELAASGMAIITRKGLADLARVASGLRPATPAADVVMHGEKHAQPVWNPYAEEWVAECLCGEPYSASTAHRAIEYLLIHVSRETVSGPNGEPA